MCLYAENADDDALNGRPQQPVRWEFLEKFLNSHLTYDTLSSPFSPFEFAEILRPDPLTNYIFSSIFPEKPVPELE